jgi:HEAT repeat protein
VVSAAFRAVGSRKDPAGIAHILTRITTSKDWYNQWNAYRALRNLGWKQSPSP